MNILKMVLYACILVSLNSLALALENKDNDNEFDELQKLLEEEVGENLNDNDKRVKLIFDSEQQEKLLSQSIERGDATRSKEYLFYTKVNRKHRDIVNKATKDLQEKLDACHESNKNNAFWKGVAVATAACSGCYMTCQLVWYLTARIRGGTT